MRATAIHALGLVHAADGCPGTNNTQLMPARDGEIDAGGAIDFMQRCRHKTIGGSFCAGDEDDSSRSR
jgi:hypothetical protein